MRDNYDFSQGVKNPYFDCLKTRSKKHMNLKSLFQNEKNKNYFRRCYHIIK